MHIDKAGVRRAFNKAAEKYDSYAGLQQKISCDLITLVETKVSDTHIALDLGSGTGYGARLLADKFPEATVIAVDIASAMMQRNLKTGKGSHTYDVCADANLLPFKENCVDLIYSTSFVQWCDAPLQLFGHLTRVLSQGGWFIFSTYGPKTLRELRSSWAKVDDFPHTLEFPSAAKIRTMLNMSGFIVYDYNCSLEVIYYEGVDAMLHNLKSLGAQNRRKDRQQGLTSTSKLRRMKEHYLKHYGVQGLIPAGYEVLLFSARLPRHR